MHCLESDRHQVMKTVIAVTEADFDGEAQLLRPARGANLKRSSWLSQLVQCLFIVSVTILSYLIITQYGLQTVKVVGNSMTPTLGDTHFYILNRLVYLVRSPQPTDVVVIRDPEDHGFCVKRVIARAGDSVSIRNGKVFVNDKPLNEPYLPQGTPTYPNGKTREQMFRLSENEFFVLGDNRMNSADSRTYGPVPRNHILGQLIY